MSYMCYVLYAEPPCSLICICHVNANAPYTHPTFRVVHAPPRVGVVNALLAKLHLAYHRLELLGSHLFSAGLRVLYRSGRPPLLELLPASVSTSTVLLVEICVFTFLLGQLSLFESPFLCGLLS